MSFYYLVAFISLVGPETRHWMSLWTKKCCYPRKGEIKPKLSPKSKHLRPSHITSHGSLSDYHGRVQAMTFYLEAVRWHLSSRHASSREWKPCISRVQSVFHKELRTLAFSQGLYKENNISRIGRQSQKEEKGGRGSKQRTQEAETIQKIGDWFYNFQY